MMELPGKNRSSGRADDRESNGRRIDGLTALAS
jgi:hypothetical protein